MLLENLHIGLIYGMKSNYDVAWATPSRKKCNSFALNQTILSLTKCIQKSSDIYDAKKVSLN
jgi:hypothetical protein